MKFDLFNESTWNPEEYRPVDPQVKLANQAVGAIGEKIGALRTLREQLLNPRGSNPPEVVEALRFQQLCPEAFKQFELEIQCPNHQKLLTQIDSVLDGWLNVEARRINWREIARQVKAILDSSAAIKTPSKHNTTTVKGNAAWNLYCALLSRANREDRSYYGEEERGS